MTPRYGQQLMAARTEVSLQRHAAAADLPANGCHFASS
jgi:hypothetical protein